MASDDDDHRPSRPRTDRESDQERQARLVRELEEDHRFGGTHWLPLFLALVPSLGSLFHGDSETWTDALLLLLVAFFLYKSTQSRSRFFFFLPSLSIDPAFVCFHNIKFLGNYTPQPERLAYALALSLQTI